MQLSAIKVMEQYARENSDVISLSQGIPSIGCDTIVRNSVSEMLNNECIDKYSDPRGIIELRDLIMKKNTEQGRGEYSNEEIIITAGAMEGLTSAILTFLNPGDEIIIPTPTYASFFKIAQTASAVVVTCPLDEEKNWHLDIDYLEHKINTKTKAILICNPNNPTGHVYSKQHLIQLAELVLKHNLILIIDEVYEHIYWGKEPLYHPYENKRYKEYIIKVGSFSKRFGMTGWRAGYIQTSKHNVEQILPVHDCIINCAPVISQYAAYVALQNEEQILPKHFEMYTKNREIVKHALEGLKSDVSFHLPEGTYYMFPKIHSVIDSEAFCMDVLRKARLSTVPGVAFGLGGEGHLRICFGKSTSEIIKGMERLTHYFKTI